VQVLPSGLNVPLKKAGEPFSPPQIMKVFSLPFIHVVQGIASRAIETRLDIRALLFSKGSEMSNDLQALDMIASVLHLHLLQQEKAPFHPFGGNLAVCLAGEVPHPNQLLQTFQIRMRRCCLVCSRSVRLLCQSSFSFQCAPSGQTIGLFPDLYAFEWRGWEGEPLLARVFIWRSDLRQNGRQTPSSSKSAQAPILTQSSESGNDAKASIPCAHSGL